MTALLGLVLAGCSSALSGMKNSVALVSASPELISDSQPAANLSIVISVQSGDTLRVLENGRAITVSLGCIDAPESAQKPWSDRATTRLRELLPSGKAIELRVIQQNKQGGLIAEVHSDGNSINLKMVQEGQAMVPANVAGCISVYDRYVQVEAEARQQRIGYWDQDSPRMPWDFRNGIETSSS
ncbi:MAG: thermonuclease family protein [Cyanothece sp. SIO1E1]|nr:thermonuclease family protein [Cyanothece sp. SIO1E1]